MINKDELIIDRIRYITCHDPATMQMVLRLSSLEETSLNVTAEGEEVVDAVGALITTLYRSQRATLGASNSLFSFNLLATQLGAKKQIAGLTNFDVNGTADNTATMKAWTVETPEVVVDGTGTGTITLKHKAVEGSIPFIYPVISGDIALPFKPSTSVSATNFVIDNSGSTTVITTPTDVTGKIWVEYQYETVEAMRVIKKASEFPETVHLNAYVYFRDKCNDNIKYSGIIEAKRAKINPENVEVALTTTGKHAFEFNIQKDYCAEDDELFNVMLAE